MVASVYEVVSVSVWQQRRARTVQTGLAVLQGCVPARCWATTGPHGPDSAETCGSTGAVLGWLFSCPLWRETVVDMPDGVVKTDPRH